VADAPKDDAAGAGVEATPLVQTLRPICSTGAAAIGGAFGATTVEVMTAPPVSLRPGSGAGTAVPEDGVAISTGSAPLGGAGRKVT
jgi:hypothetical protein